MAFGEIKTDRTVGFLAGSRNFGALANTKTEGGLVCFLRYKFVGGAKCVASGPIDRRSHSNPQGTNEPTGPIDTIKFKGTVERTCKCEKSEMPNAWGGNTQPPLTADDLETEYDANEGDEGDGCRDGKQQFTRINKKAQYACIEFDRESDSVEDGGGYDGYGTTVKPCPGYEKYDTEWEISMEDLKENLLDQAEGGAGFDMPKDEQGNAQLAFDFASPAGRSAADCGGKLKNREVPRGEDSWVTDLQPDTYVVIGTNEYDDAGYLITYARDSESAQEIIDCMIGKVCCEGTTYRQNRSATNATGAAFDASVPPEDSQNKEFYCAEPPIGGIY